MAEDAGGSVTARRAAPVTENKAPGAGDAGTRSSPEASSSAMSGAMVSFVVATISSLRWTAMRLTVCEYLDESDYCDFWLVLVFGATLASHESRPEFGVQLGS